MGNEKDNNLMNTLENERSVKKRYTATKLTAGKSKQFRDARQKTAKEYLDKCKDDKGNYIVSELEDRGFTIFQLSNTVLEKIGGTSFRFVIGGMKYDYSFTDKRGRLAILEEHFESLDSKVNGLSGRYSKFNHSKFNDGKLLNSSIPQGQFQTEKTTYKQDKFEKPQN